MLALIILSILITWLLMAVVSIGIGSLLLRLATSQRPSVVESFWSGIAAIAAILQLYHFLRPIDAIIVALLCVLAFCGLFFTFWRCDIPTFRRSDVFLFFLAAVFIAFRSAAPTEHYDTGLYGAQAIRWFTTYPLVPGLGNLLGQLGFNSSIFLCIAALSHGPLRDLAHHVFSGFLLAVIFASILPAVLRVLRSQDISSDASRAGNNSASDWFLTFLFLPAAIWAATGKLSGANTDLPTTIVCLAAVSFLFRAFDSQPRESFRENPDANGPSPLFLVLAMPLFSLAVTFKLSSLLFALIGWIVAFLALCFSGAVSPTRRKRFALAAVFFSVLIIIPWICRGLVLTGYPFFPSPAFGISADWTVPAANAQEQADFARSFARIPQIPLADTSGYHWLQPWFRELIREREGFLIPIFFMLAGALFLAANSRRKNRAALPRWLWLLLPSFAGIVFWFFQAPAIRFGEPALWTAAATLGTFAAVHELDSLIKKRLFIFSLLLSIVWAAHPYLLWNSYFRPSFSVRAVPLLPQPRVVPEQTFSGLTIYVPVVTNQCWDAPLPCSPYFSDTLRLRRPNELGSGFVSKGPVGQKSALTELSLPQTCGGGRVCGAFEDRFFVGSLIARRRGRARRVLMVVRIGRLFVSGDGILREFGE